MFYFHGKLWVTPLNIVHLRTVERSNLSRLQVRRFRWLSMVSWPQKQAELAQAPRSAMKRTLT